MEWQMRSSSFASTLHLQVTAVVAIFVVLIVNSVGKVTTGVTGDVFAAVGMAMIYGLLILLGIAAAIFGWIYFVRTRVGAAFVARWLPRVPILGPILQGMGRIRFVRVLGALWKAGVSPLESLEIAANTTGNRHFIRQIKESLGTVTKGASLSGAIGPTGFLPSETLYMLQTGETTGSVAESLEKVAEYFTVDVEAKVKTLPTKLMLLTYAVLIPIVFYILFKFYTGGAGGTMPTSGDF
jgi:type IV pilus assembly protein PilC